MTIDRCCYLRDLAKSRISDIDVVLKNTDCIWRRDVEKLRTERDNLVDDIKGYSVIIAHLETGIGISRYQNSEHAYRIIKREREAKKRRKNG